MLGFRTFFAVSAFDFYSQVNKMDEAMCSINEYTVAFMKRNLIFDYVNIYTTLKCSQTFELQNQVQVWLLLLFSLTGLVAYVFENLEDRPY